MNKAYNLMRMTGARTLRKASALRIRANDPAFARNLYFAALAITVLSTILGFYKGQFGDEDEKIAAVIYAAQGESLYGGQLINHGPLPFMFAGLGYRIFGAPGALTALRLLPASLAILSTFLIAKTPLIGSALLRSYVALSWSLFLSIFWTIKTIHMSIYHGLGGLLATILTVGVLLPLAGGDRRILKLSLTACIVGAYLLLASLTFLPFVFSALVTLFAVFRLGPSDCNVTASSRLSGKDGLSSRWVSALGLGVGLLGLISFLLLVVCGVVSLKGIYYGHIYFNQSIFSKLASPLNLSLVLFRRHDLMVLNILRVTLFCSVLLVPACLQFLPGSSIGRPRWRALALLPASLGLVSLSYRAGLGSISSFYALPYLLPATALTLIGCVAIYESYRRSPLGYRRSLLERLLIFMPLSLVILFSSYRFFDPEFATGNHLGTANHILTNSSLSRRPIEDEMVSKLLSEIESNEPGKRASIFAWPFNPVFFALYDRPSAYPINWFLWYNELVENDPKMKAYHACNPSLGLTQSPDILYYARWLIYGQDSEKYGKCLLRIMEKDYIRISEKIYLRRDHAELLRSFYMERPYFKNLVTILTPLNWNYSLELPSHFLPTLLQRNHTTSYLISAATNRRFDTVGISLPVFKQAHKGEVSICLRVLPSGLPVCSGKIDMAMIRDDEMARFLLQRPLIVKAGAQLELSITSFNRPVNDSRKNLSILIEPRSGVPLLYVGQRNYQGVLRY
jgi:hypothetical protein